MRRKYRYWKINEVRYIERNLHLSDIEIAKALLSRTASDVSQYRFRHKLWKPWWNRRGSSNGFRKKGEIFLRGTGKGHRLYIKPEEGKAMSYARWVYQQANNMIIGQGYILLHRDGNPMNCNIDNLELITMVENARRMREKRAIRRKAA